MRPWEEILRVLQELGKTVPLTTTTKNPEKLREIFGSRYHKGMDETVPMLNERVDMRLFDVSALELEDDSGPLQFRDAAARLINLLSTRTGEFALVAVSGAGKTSAIFDVARKHFVVYFQFPDTPERRRSREGDPTASELLEAVTTEIGSHQDSDSRMRAWRIARRASMRHFVARLLFLVLLNEYFLRSDEKRQVLPFEFLIAQLAHACVRAVLKELLPLVPTVEEHIEKLAELIWTYLTSHYLVAKRGENGRTLLFALDEVEAGAQQLPARFLRHMPSAGQHARNDKAFASPVFAGARLIAEATSDRVLLSGTGSTEERVRSFMSDIGKVSTSSMDVLRQPRFPVASAASVRAMLCILEPELAKSTTPGRLCRRQPQCSTRPRGGPCAARVLSRPCAPVCNRCTLPYCRGHF